MLVLHYEIFIWLGDVEIVPYILELCLSDTGWCE